MPPVLFDAPFPGVGVDTPIYAYARRAALANQSLYIGRPFEYHTITPSVGLLFLTLVTIMASVRGSEDPDQTSIKTIPLDTSETDARTNITSDTNDLSDSHRALEDNPLHHRTVDVGFFDPSGVAELRRSMSRASAGQRGRVGR
ncbi:hypothetical protein QCA50_013412 [Cerrena zonata]|uniref:Uncharacterized protein n=1 Tax=Cerrena zonata TaxID=2478898 RepID=A0AAW0FZH6_9APHY